MQSRYISEVNFKRRRSVIGIHDKYVSTLDGLSRIELWGFHGGSCRRYKWPGGFSHSGVLMEREKLGIRDDSDVLGTEFRKLHVSDASI